mmetsp:Transcript_35041/g.87371  ORF Transcript_35041/g.87371 Transcript_35041/m.87371 type:complete len:238 (-) Transcript_35041:492-1205(-)
MCVSIRSARSRWCRARSAARTWFSMSSTCRSMRVSLVCCMRARRSTCASIMRCLIACLASKRSSSRARRASSCFSLAIAYRCIFSSSAATAMACDFLRSLRKSLRRIDSSRAAFSAASRAADMSRSAARSSAAFCRISSPSRLIVCSLEAYSACLSATCSSRSRRSSMRRACSSSSRASSSASILRSMSFCCATHMASRERLRSLTRSLKATCSSSTAWISDMCMRVCSALTRSVWS